MVKPQSRKLVKVSRLIAFFFLLSSLPSIAQAQPAFPLPSSIDTTSPQATVRSFLSHRNAVEALFRQSQGLTQRELIGAADQLVAQMGRLLDLSLIAPTSRRKAGSEAVARLVDVLDRVTIPPLDSIPDARSVPEIGKPSSWTLPGTELRLVRAAQGERAGEFLFSAETVERLPELYGSLQQLPRKRMERTVDWTATQLQSHGWLLPMSFVSSLPPSLKVIVAGNPIWKLLATSAVIATLALFTFVGHRWSRSFGRMQGTSRYVRVVFLPLVFGLLLWLSHYVLIEQLSLTGWIAMLVDRGATALLYIAGAWFAWLACAAVTEYIISSPAIPDESLDAHLLRLLGKVGGIASAISIIAFGAQQIGLPILGVLAGVGVGGLAVALAAQNSIENLIAGLNLYVDRPIRVGDRCRCGQVEGVVEQIGLRSTRIRALDRSVTSIPNSDVAKAQLINLTMRDQMLFCHVLDLRYETSLEQLRELTSRILAFLQAHAKIRSDVHAPRVHIVELAAWSIKLEVFAYVDARRQPEFLPIQQDLLRALKSMVAEAGVEFAFPSQTNYLLQARRSKERPGLPAIAAQEEYAKAPPA